MESDRLSSRRPPTESQQRLSDLVGDLGLRISARFVFQVCIYHAGDFFGSNDADRRSTTDQGFRKSGFRCGLAESRGPEISCMPEQETGCTAYVR